MSQLLNKIKNCFQVEHKIGGQSLLDTNLKNDVVISEIATNLFKKLEAELGEKGKNLHSSTLTISLKWEEDEKRLHIIYRKGRWAVFKQGSSRATRIYKCKESAINHALKMSEYSIIVHYKDGSIEDWINPVINE